MIRFVDVYDHRGAPMTTAVRFLYDLIAQRMTEPEVNISAKMPVAAIGLPFASVPFCV